MFKKIMAAGIFLVSVSGCGSSSSSDSRSTYVRPSINNVDGVFSKINRNDLNDTNGSLKNIIIIVEKASNAKSDDISLDTDKLEANNTATSSVGVTRENKPSCIQDGITTRQTKTAAYAKGTFAFNHCDLWGLKINGSFYIDYIYEKAKDNSRQGNYPYYKWTIKYYTDIKNFSVENNNTNSSISVSHAKFNGIVIESEDDHGGATRGSVDFSAGISAYAEDNGSKLIIWNGLNGTYSSQWDREKKTDSYEGSLSGYIGSDATGMFKLSTPVKVKSDGTHCYPNKGTVRIEGKDENMTIEAKGRSIKVKRGNETKTYNCKKR